MRSALSEHLEGVGGTYAHGEASVRNEYPGPRVGLGALVRDDDVLVFAGVGD